MDPFNRPPILPTATIGFGRLLVAVAANWDVRVNQEDNTRRFFGLSGPRCSRLGMPSFGPVRALVAVTIGLFVLLTGCGGSGPGSAGAPEPESVRVFAAASLTDVFGELATAFEAANPEYDIQLNLAGSAALRTQILGGAQADVFAAASMSIMDEIVAAQAAGGEIPLFATNRLLIAVPVANEAGVRGLADLQRADLFLGLCAEGVPCGDLAAQVLANAGITAEVDTYEPNVRSLLAKVSAGELDAGLVYATDVAADPAVTGIELPDDLAARATYPITVLDDAASPDGGEAFVNFVIGVDGRKILADHGFGAP